MKWSACLFLLCLTLSLSSQSAVAQGVFPTTGDELLELMDKANDGVASAQRDLGLMYYLGHLGTTAESKPKAAEWFIKSAAQGDPTAQVMLGMMYLNGESLPRDTAKAILLFQTAAEQGSAGGSRMLSKLYLRGQSVARDYVKAYMWLNIANAQNKNGDNGGLNGAGLDAFEKKMTPGQIAEAQQKTQEWLAVHPPK